MLSLFHWIDTVSSALPVSVSVGVWVHYLVHYLFICMSSSFLIYILEL